MVIFIMHTIIILDFIIAMQETQWYLEPRYKMPHGPKHLSIKNSRL